MHPSVSGSGSSCKTVVLGFTFWQKRDQLERLSERRGRGEREVGGGGEGLLLRALFEPPRWAACPLFSCACEIAQVALHLPPSPTLSTCLSSPTLNLPYRLLHSQHFFFLPPISFCSLSSPLNSFISFCSLILMILPLSSRSVSVSLWVMQWALPGFVCLTALQELLLAHREHYSVDLLAAGVRRGQTKGGGVQE